MKKKVPKYTKEDYKIDFLYAFPKYRVLLVELDEHEREIGKLENNIEYYKRTDIENRQIIKQKNRIIFRLRKEIKELKENVRGHKTRNRKI